MANLCSTSYVIEGQKEVLQKIYVAVNETKCNAWEGEILLNLGYTLKELEKYKLRGSIYYLEDFDGDVIRLQCEEAWVVSDFSMLLEKKFDVKVYYMAEEPGCEYYVTNDDNGIYFPERVFVDVCINGNFLGEYFYDTDEAYDYVYELSGLRTDDEIEEFNNADNDDFIYIHEYDVV